VNIDRALDKAGCVPTLLAGLAASVRLCRATNAAKSVTSRPATSCPSPRYTRADVSYVLQPFEARGLQVQALLAEPRVAVLPAGHHLAGKDAISITDLADEHLLQDPDAVPEWRDIATEMRTGRRRSAPRLPHS
jgi:DNA-binding transcriptional LysR family regulator